jgi:hypothetical protein
MDVTSVLMVGARSRYMNTTGGWSFNVLSDFGENISELSRRCMVIPGAVVRVMVCPPLNLSLASLLVGRDAARGRLAGGGGGCSSMVRCTPTPAGLVPIQTVNGALLHMVLFILIQSPRLDTVTADVHVAVDALLKTVHIALVAVVAPHGSDDCKLESRVRCHGIA